MVSTISRSVPVTTNPASNISIIKNIFAIPRMCPKENNDGRIRLSIGSHDTVLAAVVLRLSFDLIEPIVP